MHFIKKLAQKLCVLTFYHNKFTLDHIHANTKTSYTVASDYVRCRDYIYLCNEAINQWHENEIILFSERNYFGWRNYFSTRKMHNLLAVKYYYMKQT